MAAEPVTADDLAALRERVEALEAERESLADMLAAKTGVTRRQVLLALGAGGGMGALASGGVQADASTSDSDGDVGLPGERVDIFADGVDAQSLEGGVVGSGGPIDQLDGAGLTVASNQLGLPSTIPGSVVSNLGTAASPLSDVETQAFGGGGSAISVDDDLDLQGAQSLLGASAIGGGGSSVALDDDLADGSGTTLVDRSVPAWATQVGLAASPVTAHLASLANNGSSIAVNDHLDLQGSQQLQGVSSIGGGGSAITLDDDVQDAVPNTLIDQSVPAWATQVGVSSSPVTGHLSSLANNGSAVSVHDDLDLQSSQALQNADVAGIISQLDIPVYSSDGNAPNETLFFHDGDGAIKYKDSAGTVHSGGSGGVSAHALGGAAHNADEFADLNGKVSDENLIPASRSLAGGDGIGNIGDLSSDRTIAVVLASSGGLTFDSGQLAVNVSDFGGSDLSDDGSGNLALGDDSVAQQELAVDPFVYDPGMTNWADGLSNEEINRIALQSGETLVVNRIEFRQKGGGSSASASIDVRDTGAGSTVGSANLGSTTKDPGSSGSGNTVIVRLNNSTGGAIKAAPRVEGWIAGV